MTGEKKRPRGLKSSAMSKANKKAKSEESAKPNEIPENAQTIVIDKEVEEGDELGETAALLESAAEKLEVDPNEALPLLRGTIHESDRILRNWDSDSPLPASFYYAYGVALYELGRLTEDEEFEPYLDAAEERLTDSQSHLEEEKNTELEPKVQLALIKVWFAKAASQVSDEENVPELATRALDAADKVLGNLSSKATIELADIIQNHGALYSSLKSRDRFIVWSEKALEKILKDEPENAQALFGLGLCKLQTAHYWLDNMNEEEEEEKTKLSEEEEKAYKAIIESKKYLELAQKEFAKENKLTPQVLADLAEVYLNEANLVLDEEKQNEIYEQAIKVIKEAQTLIAEKSLDYALPEGLLAFLAEYES
ncbi:hypothetical protein G6F16_002477 [Rhizopus arrhizus]|nr:hypothetical protein G6F24_005655 [Rhizopus arrhizus]KAG0790476.1 hypothetical protein G6F21_005781 [Rhizopus arrhizus]KAG0798156.1 hypothetical protein G6F22_004501 [Rhizopus arrhizus]KAG0819756.1 hypothetical protein G6F20_000499 [Rhizopus arrhizus]KAG0835231.1 hypothetical protein G6F19_004810 [Rhizopus arrhizus]